MENIYYLFDNSLAYQIHITPLISMAQQDRRIWKLEKTESIPFVAHTEASWKRM